MPFRPSLRCSLLVVAVATAAALWAADLGQRVDFSKAEGAMRARYGEAGLARLQQWRQGQTEPPPSKPAETKTDTAPPRLPEALPSSDKTTQAPDAAAQTAPATAEMPANAPADKPAEPAGKPLAVSQSTGAKPAEAAATQLAVTPEPAKPEPAKRPTPERATLERVNDLVNQLAEYSDDPSIWGQVDYWATPLELFGKGAADCEDYAIAKFFTLVLQGIPPQQLRMVYVRANLGTRELPEVVAHMVLAWYAHPRAEPLILDNLVPEIRPASQRPDLVPVYSFNHDGVWLGADASKPPAGSAARLSRWQDLLARMAAEGFHFQ